MRRRSDESPSIRRAIAVARRCEIGALFGAFRLAGSDSPACDPSWSTASQLWAAGFPRGLLTQARMIGGFERLNGERLDFRRNHAAGLCIEGSFERKGKVARLSITVVFAAGRSREASCSDP
jgi:hypothetical protein